MNSNSNPEDNHPSPLLQQPKSTPTPLDLSPSKARTHHLEAQSWSLVNTWLSQLYHPSPVPAYERSPATLQTLQSLMQANQKADRRRLILHEARREELIYLQACQDAERDLSRQEVLQDLEVRLDSAGKTALESLANASVILGRPMSLSHSRASSTNEQQGVTTRIAQGLVDLTVQTQHLETQLQSLAAQQLTLDAEIQRTREAITNLNRKTSESRTEQMQMQTAQFLRETKQINVKVGEYRERIAVLERVHANLGVGGGVRIEDLRERERGLEVRKRQVKELEGQLGLYHGLPPDVQASRSEVKRAQLELDGLKTGRGELFEKLGQK